MTPITDQLFIGDIEQAGDRQRYKEHGIDRVIQLTYSAPDNGYPDSVDVHTYSMMDGPRNDEETMRDAVETTASFLQKGDTVLVHCSAGASRSVAVAAASLATVNDTGLDEELQLIRDKKPIQIHPSVQENAENVLR
jgi:protein-tyrosine phosphatase